MLMTILKCFLIWIPWRYIQVLYSQLSTFMDLFFAFTRIAMFSAIILLARNISRFFSLFFTLNTWRTPRKFNIFESHHEIETFCVFRFYRFIYWIQGVKLKSEALCRCLSWPANEKYKTIYLILYDLW